MLSDDYWQGRSAQRLLEAEQIALRAEIQIKRAFDEATKAIEAEVYTLYGKYATDNSLTYAEALVYLTKDERKEFQRDLAFYLEKARDKDYRQEHRAYLQALSVRARVQRLTAYKARLQMIAEELYSGTVIPEATRVMATVAHDSYWKAGFDIMQGVGVMLAFDQPPLRLIDTVLEYPWSGKSFSQKWQDNCTDFERVLDETLTKGLVRGTSSQKIAKELAAKTGAAYNRAICLVRTETNFAHSEATAATYEALGVETYKYLATLDIKTSTICRELDGHIFLMSKRSVGTNSPPLHPRCRSTTTAVLYEDSLGTRVARDADGKTIKVPRAMTYKGWHDQYVKTNPEYVKQEKRYKNHHADQRQYKRYQELLGEDKLIKSFAEFQDMKYNGGVGWNALQAQYRTANARYKDYQYNKDGTIRVTDDMKGLRYSPPQTYKPYAVVETFSVYKSGYRQIDRTFYNDSGVLQRQVHSGYHNNPKGHPFGESGEHQHVYEWDDRGNRAVRSKGELTPQDRKENKDIIEANRR